MIELKKLIARNLTRLNISHNLNKSFFLGEIALSKNHYRSLKKPLTNAFSYQMFLKQIMSKNSLSKTFKHSIHSILACRLFFRPTSPTLPCPVKLPRLEPIDKQSRFYRWIALKSLASKGDLLFTFDTANLFSKIISLVDSGPWSHCAIYTGAGTVIEAIASGVCERSIDIYADSRYRLGLYRLRSDLQDQDNTVESDRSIIGQPYCYRKAVVVGVKKLLRLPRSFPTPNDFAIHPEIELLNYV